MRDERIRLRLEETEERVLSPYAQRSRSSRGRAVPEEPSFMRTEFMRDRDRIVHSKSFRRLKHKTQVFISPLGDHFATRLTHTIEVAQVARSIARALALNEDLTEAIALGHDLGHTPFGHLGEEFLNERLPGGYRHAEQSLRIVDSLEKEGQGLNLTWEVRQGILRHSKGQGRRLALGPTHEGETLESQVCRVSDFLAYINHDLSDAVRAGVLREDELPEEVRCALGARHAERLDTLIGDVVARSWAATGDAPPPEGQRPVIGMSPEVLEAALELRDLLFQRVYVPAGAGAAGRQAREALEVLWETYVRHPEMVPQGYVRPEDPPERRAADYISGMTDRFALGLAEALQRGEGVRTHSPDASGIGARGRGPLATRSMDDAHA